MSTEPSRVEALRRRGLKLAWFIVVWDGASSPASRPSSRIS